jgi:hypothetical protein
VLHLPTYANVFLTLIDGNVEVLIPLRWDYRFLCGTDETTEVQRGHVACVGTESGEWEAGLCS